MRENDPEWTSRDSLGRVHCRNLGRENCNDPDGASYKGVEL